MGWDFTRVAGPFRGACGGIVWDGSAILFSAVEEERILRFEPASGAVSELRRYTQRTNGLALGPDGELYGAQEGGRRIIQFMRDGSITMQDALLDGRHHNQPCDLAVDRQGRIWFCDPHHPVAPFGPAIFPMLEHASVLRLQRNDRRAWTLQRLTFDTAAPRALALSADERTLYVADGDARSAARELRAYPVGDDGSLGRHALLQAFGADHRGPQRGVEGLCLDADGNIVACGGWRRSGPGPLISVFSPAGRILETHAFPGDLPMRCAFGGADLRSLFVTTGEGELYRAEISRRGLARPRAGT
jgi:gluconolactonase